MSKRYEHVKQWRKRTKERLVNAFNNECGICKYNKCIEALEFHHIDPSQKDFNISNWKKFVNWTKLVEEAKKCILLCCRCHREIHSKILDIPSDIQMFKDEFSIYEKHIINPNQTLTPCLYCQTMKSDHKSYCSQSCAAKKKNHNAYENFDIPDMYLNQKLSVSKIAKKVGLSDVAIHKRLKKLGLKK